MSNPPTTQVEVEANVTNNNNTADDTDVVMPEANNEAPEANVAPEANAAPDVIIPPEAIVPLAAHVNENANAPVPPPRPHIVELAFDCGQPVMVRWPMLVPPPAAGPQFDYHVEHRPQV